MTLFKVNNTSNGKTIDSLFDELFNNLPSSKFNSAIGGFNFPPVNIYETKEGYELQVQAPGRNKEEFNIVVDKGLLTISYEKKQENADLKNLRNEFSLATFKRSFKLDASIDHENISAKYENGILILNLVKKEQAKETIKQINIQ